MLLAMWGVVSQGESHYLDRHHLVEGQAVTVMAFVKLEKPVLLVLSVARAVERIPQLSLIQSVEVLIMNVTMVLHQTHKNLLIAGYGYVKRMIINSIVSNALVVVVMVKSVA
jgi:hypothetical protein